MLWGVKAVVPRKLQQRVLMEIQQSYQGIVQMKNLTKSYVWWPRLDAKIEELVKSCQQCHLNTSAAMGVAFQTIGEHLH